MKLCSLRSGSRGNAILAFTNKTKILIDCGISGKIATDCLADIDILPGEIDAILITHEHSDHIKGAGIFSRRFDIPIYANSKTWQSMYTSLGRISSDNIKVFDKDLDFEIGDIGVKPFEIPHDAADPVGYSFTDGKKKISVATDIGKTNDIILNALKGSSIVLLESNHDLNMLDMGNYPIHLKRRIKGDFGHLCNDAAAEFACKLADSGTNKILLGHLSEENNYPDLAYQTVKNVLEQHGINLTKDLMLNIALRNETSQIYEAV